MKKNVLKLLAAFLVLPAMLVAQNDVSGKITDEETGKEIPFASIHIDGTFKQTMSDMDGVYSLHGIQQNNCCFIFTYLGYLNDTVCVDLTVSKTVDAKMKRAKNLLE